MEQDYRPSFLFCTSALLTLYSQVCRKPSLEFNRDDHSLEKIVRECRSLNEVYYPPILCWGAHLQLIPFVVSGLIARYVHTSIKWISEEFTLSDGQTLALDWSIPPSIIGRRREELEDQYMQNIIKEPSLNDDLPILVIQHGAFCDSLDLPGQGYVEEAHRRGWLVLCINRRGHGASRLSNTCKFPKWNFFGCVTDIREVTRMVKERRPKARLLMLGLSSGSGPVARYFGEQGLMDNEADAKKYQYHAGVGVCPGYDIKSCMGRMQWPYQDILLWRGKYYFLESNERLIGSVEGYQSCLQADNLQAWLDQSYAMAGFSSREEYYERTNPMKVVDSIRSPCMFVNAEDDPLCVIQNLHENRDKIFRDISTNSTIASDSSNTCRVLSVVTKCGSHLPFYDYLMRSWIEMVTFEFFEAALRFV